ncbi:hypothetical protein CI088_00085 [Enterococcus plantarum]|uniref:DNA-binding protein n=1 Tax=Enterococcus plantarum TaxID=1077675 RepID=A0A2W4BLT3_9ENTE|nr:helix-turn-helix domain-containing protein [Enterococcus plantarum]PZL78205.1 hypothetical protein CI088_00085 [Enterococcus plantarum]
MSASIIQIRPNEDTDRQVDAYIVERLEAVFTKVFGMIDPYDSEDLLNIEEACKFLKGCAEGTLNKYVGMGLKKHKDGQKVYYLRKEIIEFIATLPAE